MHGSAMHGSAGRLLCPLTACVCAHAPGCHPASCIAASARACSPSGCVFTCDVVRGVVRDRRPVARSRDSGARRRSRTAASPSCACMTSLRRRWWTAATGGRRRRRWTCVTGMTRSCAWRLLTRWPWWRRWTWKPWSRAYTPPPHPSRIPHPVVPLLGPRRCSKVPRCYSLPPSPSHPYLR